MPSTLLAYPQVISRRFASSNSIVPQLTGIFGAGSISGSSTRNTLVRTTSSASFLFPSTTRQCSAVMCGWIDGVIRSGERAADEVMATDRVHGLRVTSRRRLAHRCRYFSLIGAHRTRDKPTIVVACPKVSTDRRGLTKGRLAESCASPDRFRPSAAE